MRVRQNTVKAAAGKAAVPAYGVIAGARDGSLVNREKLTIFAL